MAMVSARGSLALARGVSSVVLLAACDRGSGVGAPPSAPAACRPAARAAGFDAGPIKTAAEYLCEPEFAAADAARGELLGLACAACHRFRADEGTLIGPNLHGVFGRPAGPSPASATRRRSLSPGSCGRRGSLEAWLEDPAGFVEGTTMAFTGYRSAADRRDLIAYLLRATQ